MAGRRAHCHRARRRLRVPGPEVHVAVRRRSRHHRYALEWAALLGLAQSLEWEVKTPVRKLRCAIYTRKSSEEGLEMEFNSLDAQREAGLAYIHSQKSEGWMLVGDRYDDGGFSGGSMERPALQRLLRDVEAGIDVIVVYKVDRLSR